MKKSFIYLTAAVAVFAMASCGSNASDAGNADSAATANTGAVTYTVAPESVIGWRGSKVAGIGEHKGSIAISEGSLSVENGKLTAGSFTIDMNNIVCTDSITDEYKQKLIGHFQADDFFNVAKFPTAKFEITSVEEKAEGTNTHVISGNLTLRDSVKNISIPAAVTIDGTTFTAKGSLSINRLDWGVNYDKANMSLSDKAKAALKNGVVSETIEISLDIKATAATEAPAAEGETKSGM
jgi:polyisoprenoid-binding protein YceI